MLPFLQEKGGKIKHTFALIYETVVTTGRKNKKIINLVNYIGLGLGKRIKRIQERMILL